MKCQRHGCSGTITDGYCDVCGLAPTKEAGAASGDTASERFDVTRLTRRTASTGTAARRSRVGAGVVELAPVQPIDPATVVLADASVPEDRRFCGQCGGPVGRNQKGKAGRQSGFCPTCGTRFNFAAQLQPGELVANQYEVVGAIAHGGLGWVYLARDRNVSGRWCVLKGLLDTADPDAAEAAVAERRFLAEVAHPAVVEIFNFVNHEDQGYIVMEYVGGPSLKQIAKRHRDDGKGPLPVTEAAAYLLAVLPALGYLHSRGLVYCDFKPDNVIHVGDSVKLIDLGGVRRLDDQVAAIFGTVGYQAPEVPDTGPTIASDLYTVGRALAVLILDWPSWQTANRERLPDRASHPVLVANDSLWRFLQRACAARPEDRFANADEMADSLHGVLCQVASAADGLPRPRTSTRFTPPRPRLEGLDWAILPSPLLPNHPTLPNRVAGIAESDPEATLTLAGGTDDLSWADAAVLVRTYVELGDTAAATGVLARLDGSSPDAAEFVSILQTARDYLAGIIALEDGRLTEAVQSFESAYARAPGEAACSLALASALEAAGDVSRAEEAADLFEEVAVADPTWLPAVAGMARALRALGRGGDAARVLTAVPTTHPSRAEALTLACRSMAEGDFDPVVGDAAVEHLRGRRGRGTVAEAELEAAVYRAGLAGLARGEDIGDRVGTVPADKNHLARATEAALLHLAELTNDEAQRVRVLDEAARTRPWSVW